MSSFDDSEGAALLEVVLLGPVEVRVNGVEVPLTPLERNLFALLALSPGKVWSTERIIDDLWAERPPAAPRSRVQGLVSSLRRKIGDVLVTRQPGYLLDLSDGRCDLSQCEDLARRAREEPTPDEAANLLRQALVLWRGDPLDGVFVPGLDGERVRLGELRVGLLEEHFDVELRLGRYAEVVSELVTAVLAYPLRERLAGRLMLALYRCNRRAEALLTYQALRERLAEQLGSDPCGEVSRLHSMILRGEETEETTPPPVEPEAVEEEPQHEHRPAQMPASVGHFTGRAEELRALTAAVPDPNDEPGVVVVSGPGGLGKTALVVHWAHTVADRFPDGQIFVDLRGANKDTAMTLGSALGAVLLALGIAADQLPVSAEERSALYRTLTHRRRVLLVADDAGSFGQLLPLVPPTAGSLVVATSRNRLSALTAHHAVSTLNIDPLSPTAARALLYASAGPTRLSDAEATEMVHLCGGWPLAIRLAGTTLMIRPGQSAATLIEELRERIDLLSVADDPRTVSAALAKTRANLDDATARLFAQLGLLPGATICLQLAAATAGTSLLRARRLLDELVAANLVVETGPDRYWLHDMIRRFARRCGMALTDRTIVEQRIIRWYLAAFAAVASRNEPGRQWPLVVGQPEWSPISADNSNSERFIEAESPNLPAIVQWVATREDDELTWRLVGLAHAAGAPIPAEACRLGLEAAERLNDWCAVGEAHAILGTILLRAATHLDQAEEHLSLAVVLLEPGDDRLFSYASFALGALCARQGRLAQAATALEGALRFLDPGREPLSYAAALLTCAEILVRSGSSERGHERFAQAVILCETVTGRHGDRFDRGSSELDEKLAGECLAYLRHCLTAPRVSASDHAMARVLIDIAHAARADVEVTVPRQRSRQDVEPPHAISGWTRVEHNQI